MAFSVIKQTEYGAPDSLAEHPAVSVHDLWMTFPGERAGKEVRVLEQISVDIQRGELVCFVGPTGCGKTTLLNIVGGFLTPTRGRVLVRGEPVAGPDPRRILIFQEGGVFPWCTVQENVALGLARRSEAERRDIVQHYIRLVGLVGFEAAYPRELSGGMRQRVEIARALAAGPEIIYMDEPFGALDCLTRFKMRADLVRIWQQERKTILFVTHDIDEAIQLADRVIVLNHRPATIQMIVPVDRARPRDLDSSEYRETRQRILTAMGLTLRNGMRVVSLRSPS
jgi:NitT/TauT family transport system ATP-binding protein